MTMTMTARPAKLQDGSWGARVQGTVAVGDVVQITTAAGKSWSATVRRILWSGDGVTICATQSQDARPRSQKFRGYGRGFSRACRTGGNCSSMGSGRSCGGHDCDGF